MLTNLINSLLIIFGKMGYSGIIFLMTLESTFIPLPSEFVIPPAAYLAQKGEMNIIIVILCGMIGSVLGALINYYLGATLGRAVIYRLARMKIAKLFFVNEQKIVEAEKYFLEYGNISTFLGRFLIGIRHLISIPAGMAKMNLKNFIFFTALGSGLWCTILATLGYYFGAKQDLILANLHKITTGFIIGSIIVMAIAIYRHQKKKKG